MTSRHSLPQALSRRDGKGLNYKQLDLKLPSGCDLRLQSWREEVEMCALSQLLSTWEGGRSTPLKNLSPVWACAFHEGLVCGCMAGRASSPQRTPTQHRLTECLLRVGFLPGKGHSVVTKMDQAPGLTELMSWKGEIK